MMQSDPISVLNIIELQALAVFAQRVIAGLTYRNY
ncbi:hypothetical protein EDC54_10491 [Samsonia erythrinae]|uniref:Uncharacterized protein n=1 Tax=Samsonia erythrinae TaxID=160434 RepID=A0A4R3VN93_9GAMM|nr:hypothetical protein EDC54_10491 [Samsonia erythrinae]